MSNFTDWAENEVCRLFAGGAASFPASLSVALCASAGDAGFSDVAGLSRVDVARNLSSWSGTQGAGTTTASTVTSRSISNNSELDFGEAGESVTANAVGIYSGENPLAYVPMNSPMTINAGDAVKIGAGEIILTISTVGGLTHFACNKLLDLIFRGQAYAFPATYKIGLFVVAPTLAGGGTEASGTGYARADLSAWTAPSGGTISNASQIQFNAPQSTWGTIEAGALFSGGDMIFTAGFSEAKTIVAGAGAPKFAAGAIVLTVQ